MKERRSPHRLHLDRLAALCRQVERAIKRASLERANAYDALELLMDAQRKSTQLCEEVDRLLPPLTPPSRSRRKGGDP